MELFPNGGFVRLRSRARDKYVHADADASGVSLRPLGAAPSVNAVWKPEHWPGEEDIFLLQGAAYGRYLAVSDQDAPPGHRGVRAVQRDYNSPHVDAPFMWTAFRVDADQNYVRLHNHQRWLRANGRHRYWNNVVTVDTRNGSLTTMMQWRVEAIPVSPQPLPLLPPPQQPTIHVSRGLFKRRAKVHPFAGRMIRHVQMDDDGFIHDKPEFNFNDYSVSNLRTELALRQGDENITLCLRAGIYALAIPLITDLPHNTDPLDIIVVTTGSPGFEMLEYPQFDEPPEP
ncbi:uncharacterized protein [Zea mays]|uniref:Uncharacterized protein n=1 Tax=Zea mays TaxID=4577 RepID=A0A1D6LLF0_MAIZE|nr:uncharacterized protein LOC103629522 [Zea mays]AQK80516.1 hypothetical protein ZEAMMB73_Zm00001d036267 [Zea mays]|eukprot:XP_008648840.1 uncharacterized protein LOC103629522 [Zea mays]